MNRKIKFRAWDNKNKKMFYNISLNYHNVEKTCKPIKEGYMWFNEGNTIYHSDPMQYIGLKDKTNKEIYEGDVVKVKDNLTQNIFIGYVDFKDASFVIKTSISTHYRWQDYEIEVLGNIYENSELLERYDININNS